jgi:hypothetical protein
MDGAACVDAWSAEDGDRVGLSGAWAVGGIAALVFEVVVAAGHACVDSGEVSNAGVVQRGHQVGCSFEEPSKSVADCI